MANSFDARATDVDPAPIEQLVGPRLLCVLFDFFDRRFDFRNDYGFEVDLAFVPRRGDEVRLPGIEGGGPLRDLQSGATAEYGLVESVIWDVDQEDGPSVHVMCKIEWSE